MQEFMYIYLGNQCHKIKFYIGAAKIFTAY